ncbi:hypothetical protein [Allokutzneria sp. A3M-2-11 16]|nr:hypothetical protein [Allokutzneria sp. A3M-2-11 16]
MLEGAFSLLDEIVDTEECGLSELAARTGLPKNGLFCSTRAACPP